VPDVLVSGDHAAVARWRRAEAEHITRERRPDLWARHVAAITPAPIASRVRPP
jgi:tRNA (guanine37-N1)-methyltransferase